MLENQDLIQTFGSKTIKDRFKRSIKTNQVKQIDNIEYSDVLILPGTNLNEIEEKVVVGKKISNEVKQIQDDAYYSELLKSCIINISDNYEPPPPCIEFIQQAGCFTVGTLGNISMIIGKAKSRKTYAVSMILSAAISNKLIMGTIRVNLPSKQRAVILFDTEQAPNKVHEITKRIYNLANIDECDTFFTYGLRGLSTEERLGVIDHAIYHTPNLGFVVIDGIRDLISSINDEDQATMINSNLMKWTQGKNIHIIVVLHQNKNDPNARGHVGSELTNKCETVMEVARYSKDEKISVITGMFCREREFEPCAFKIDEAGLPYSVEDWENKSVATFKPTPSEIPIEIHKKILSEVFATTTQLTCGDLTASLKGVCKNNGYTLGNNKIGDLRQYYQAQGLVSWGKVQGKKYTMYSYTPSL